MSGVILLNDSQIEERATPSHLNLATLDDQTSNEEISPYNLFGFAKKSMKLVNQYNPAIQNVTTHLFGPEVGVLVSYCLDLVAA